MLEYLILQGLVLDVLPRTSRTAHAWLGTAPLQREQVPVRLRGHHIEDRLHQQSRQTWFFSRVNRDGISGPGYPLPWVQDQPHLQIGDTLRRNSLHH